MNIYNLLKNMAKKIEQSAIVEAITNSEIDEMFGTAAGTSTNAQDYVVEHNQTGAQGYTKWASGKMEVWKRQTTTVNITSAMSGGLYYGTISAISYPVAFIDYPVVNITAQVKGGFGWLIPKYDDYAVSNTGTLYIYYVASQPNVSVTINIHAVGRWK